MDGVEVLTEITTDGYYQAGKGSVAVDMRELQLVAACKGIFDH